MLRAVSRCVATRAAAASPPFPVMHPVGLRQASTLAGEIPSKKSAFVVASVFSLGLATGFALDVYGRSRASPGPFSGTPKPLPAPTGAAAVWRGTFDPGSNPRVTRQSVAPERSYYDTVRGGENAPSTLWQETLRSEEMNKYNFHALSRDGKTIQKEDLLRAFGQVDVDALAKDADTDGDGRISHADWLRMKSKLAEAYERAGK